ncbi:hypothetical protein [Nocardioides kribbensis]|uniref:TOMM leader peptide-binding protein n=1 Tax=Nocardioides kribbensis TaxID=305517 RepID=A0ABV1NTN0_9ACTN
MHSHTTSPPAARPTLLPGLVVATREAGRLQVGLDEPRRVVLPDHPDVRRLLAALRDRTPPTPTTPEGVRALTALVAAGLVVDADLLDAAGAGTAGPGAVAAAFAAHGDAAALLLQRRSEAVVAVEGGDTVPVAATDLAVRLLREAGAGVADPGEGRGADGGRARRTRAARAPTSRPDVVIRLSAGPPARAGLDPLLQEAQPHLLVVGGPAGVVVGPFVEPGVTACLRCVDAARAEHDPRRGLVLEQVAAAPAPVAPLDPALLHLAVSWAVRDVVTYLDGGTPSTWSTTVEIDELLSCRSRRWLRHPRCGCSWDGAQVG